MPPAERPNRPLTVATDWIEAHCVIPDGFRKGEPFRLYDVQLRYLLNYYLVRAGTPFVPDNPIMAPAFVHRRGLFIGPQKLGKNPLLAAQCTLEGVGPSVFAGWAGRNDGYSCADEGCACGWEYPYARGEPMGMSRPTALIQITAFSQDATDNTYGALRPMIEDGPLSSVIRNRGEEFMRLPRGGKIETVSSSAQSRLGNPITFVVQDELGIWTTTNGMRDVADTQYRGLAGMSGRASCVSNAYDPARHSVAQEMLETTTRVDDPVTDVYVQFERPPASLSYGNKRDRAKIHRIVYPPEVRRENGGHIDLEAIEAEATDLVARDPAQAARFFGNLLVKGGGQAWDSEHFASLAVTRPKVIPDGALITLGFDGSRLWDATALIGTEVASGYQWVINAWERPRMANAGWEVPIAEVDEAVDSAFARWDVWRMLGDPPYWETAIARWQAAYMRDGKPRVLEYWTLKHRAMAYITRAWSDAMHDDELSHCARTDRFCEMFVRHVGNAVRKDVGVDDIGDLYVVEKEANNSLEKIDCAPAAILSWEARTQAVAAGALNLPERPRSGYAGRSKDEIVARLRGDPWPTPLK